MFEQSSVGDFSRGNISFIKRSQRSNPRRVVSQFEKRSLNGKTQTIVHVSIRSTKNNQLKSSTTSLHSNSVDHFQHSSQFDENSLDQRSFSQINPYTNSSLFQSNQKQDFHSNIKDLTEYSRAKEQKKRTGFSIRRCFFILCCIFTALLLASAITAALVATLIKSNPTKSAEGTTRTMTTETTTTITTGTTTSTTSTNSILTSTTDTTSSNPTITSTTDTTSINSITSTTSQTSTITTVLTSTITTSVPPAINMHTTVNNGSYYGFESVVFACVTTLTNITIQIVVKKTSGAVYFDAYSSFATGIIVKSYVDTGTEIIYTWTIASGQVVNCVSSSYNVAAQYTLFGTPQINSADTYTITATNTAGVTTVLTGHF